MRLSRFEVALDSQKRWKCYRRKQAVGFLLPMGAQAPGECVRCAVRCESIQLARCRFPVGVVGRYVILL